MSLNGQRVEKMGIKEGGRELTVCSRKEPSSLGPGRLGLRAKGDTVVIAGVCNRLSSGCCWLTARGGCCVLSGLAVVAVDAVDAVDDDSRRERAVIGSSRSKKKL